MDCSFGHCLVCSSSIYGFWLPLWYLQQEFDDTKLFLIIPSNDNSNLDSSLRNCTPQRRNEYYFWVVPSSSRAFKRNALPCLFLKTHMILISRMIALWFHWFLILFKEWLFSHIWRYLNRKQLVCSCQCQKYVQRKTQFGSRSLHIFMRQDKHTIEHLFLFLFA